MIRKLLTGGLAISLFQVTVAHACLLGESGCSCVDSIAVHSNILSVSASAGPASRVRYDQANLSPAGRQLFVDGIKDMKNAPPRGNSPGVNNRYDEFVAQHGGFCNHLDSGFLPWHRKLLWEFESDVRALNPLKYANFTIPYWNFNKESFPSDLATHGDNGFMGPDGDPSKNYQVTHGPFSAGQYTTFESSPLSTSTDEHVLDRHFQSIENLIVPQEIINALMVKNTSFQQFSDSLQLGTFMHNAAHNYVGGQLANANSGTDDPVFWMLHSYIDMLWTQWELGRGSLTAFEQFGGGPGLNDNLTNFGYSELEPYNFGFTNIANTTAGDQLNPFNTATLGYTYDVVTLPEPSSLAMISLIGALLTRRQQRCSQ